MKILILEDDPMVSMITTRFLRQIDDGCDLECAGTIVDAHKLCEDYDFDLMLVDVYFPQGTGVEFLQEERSRGNAAVTVMITADKTPRTVEQTLALGAVDYLIKPFEFSRFQEAILRARERISYIQRSGTSDLDQKQLDKLILAEGKKQAEPLPEKGMGAQTYSLVQHIIEKHEGDFSAKEIAEESGLARVTVRRYLENMLTEGLLEMSPVYGNVGRPMHRYRRSRTR
ncbi:response regulator [Marispirochaeta sp.]|jgi:response regulator of citrate/malate metabolism|uniref:response regulator n=1 Tax=Marispirochaeta sp. TaxID=2038653 RepID=UPI0029C70149|nr:response regulator [Marispirochaeta sp.]